MWFQLNFFDDKPSIYAIVTTTGKVYFRASTVGKFLGYSNTYGFAKRYAKRCFTDIVSESFIKFQERNVRFFTFQEMISVMEKTQRNKSRVTAVIEEITHLWKCGFVPVEFPRYPALTYICAPLLRVRRKAEAYRFMGIQGWIQQYSDSLSYYYSKFYELIIAQNESIMDLSPPSVGSSIFENDNFQPPSNLSTVQDETSADESKPSEIFKNASFGGFIQSPSPSHVQTERLKDESKNASESISDLANDFEIVCDGLVKPPEQVSIKIRGTVYEYLRNYIGV